MLSVKTLVLHLSGTSSSALQGAAGKTRRAAEKSGRVTARGDQSFSVVFLREGRLSYTLHHSSADLCLTFLLILMQVTGAGSCLRSFYVAVEITPVAFMDLCVCVCVFLAPLCLKSLIKQITVFAPSQVMWSWCLCLILLHYSHILLFHS